MKLLPATLVTLTLKVRRGFVRFLTMLASASLGTIAPLLSVTVIELLPAFGNFRTVNLPDLVNFQAERLSFLAAPARTTAPLRAFFGTAFKPRGSLNERLLRLASAEARLAVTFRVGLPLRTFLSETLTRGRRSGCDADRQLELRLAR